MSGAELKAKGNEFFKKGQYEEAISWYSKAIEVEPDNHTYYSNRSAARLGLKDYKGAIEDGQNCIRCKKDWNKGYFRLAPGPGGASCLWAKCAASRASTSQLRL